MFKINVPASNVSSNLNTTGAGGFVLLISVNFLYSSAALTALTDSSTLTCISWQRVDAWLQDFWTSCSINFHLSIISIMKCCIFDLKYIFRCEDKRIIPNKNYRFCRQILPSWTACWCSNKPGNKIVLMSLSNSLASQSKRTYSLCVWCSFRQAFWYRSLQSSSLFPDLLLLYLCITFQKLVCGIW